MGLLGRYINQWLPHVFSVQLVVLALLIAAIAFYLVRYRSNAPAPRFVGLCVLGGLLTVLLIGTGFRTATVLRLIAPADAPSFLKIPTGQMIEKSLSWIKAMIALSAAGLSIYEMQLVAEKKRPPRHWVKGVALFLAVVGIGAYFRFGDLGYSNYYHRWEFFHYYLGSKYDRELGYERLYACAAVAQADSGQINEVRARKLRDLSIDVLAPAQNALDHPEQCRDRFTAERWEAFKSDVRFFRMQSGLQYWNDMQKDHGYNPPPVWTIMGHFLSSLHPADDGFIKKLAYIDLGYFAGIFMAIYWAFGWRVFSVAAVFWGCQLPAEYFWTGGAFMRQDWLFWLVLSTCLVRKRYFALGGAAFAYSTLLRVFPGILIVGWLVVAGAYIWKHKKMHPSHLRVMLGGVCATVVLGATSLVVAGPSAYVEFKKHILVHNSTPLTNNMGLPTVFAQSYDGSMEFVRDEKKLDPFDQWKRMRRERLHAFKPLWFLMVGAIGFVFVKVVRRVKSLWIAQALSLAIVVSVLEVTCYYYSMFILSAFLSRMRRGVEQWILCIAGVSQLVAINRYISYFYDWRYWAQSVLFCGFAISLLFAYWPKSKKTESAPLPVKDAAASALDVSAPQA